MLRIHSVTGFAVTSPPLSTPAKVQTCYSTQTANHLTKTQVTTYNNQ